MIFEVMRFAKPGDASWSDAFNRFLDHQERERERMKDPVRHILKRIDVSAFPLPVIIESKPLDCDSHRVSLFVQIAANGRVWRHNLLLDRDLWEDDEDQCVDMVRATLRRVWDHMFAEVLVVRSKQEVEALNG